MSYKKSLSCALALLMTTNSLAIEKENNLVFRNGVLFLTVAAIGVIAFSPKLRSWFSQRISNFFHKSTTNKESTTDTNTNIQWENFSLSGNDLIINDDKTLEAKNLPCIKPSGILESINFNSPIETVRIVFPIATIAINDDEEPRIIRDKAFKDIIFIVDDGVLTATTSDGKPRKFEYKGTPLCTVYARLKSTTLKTSYGSRVIIQNQELHNIESSGSSQISGSLNGSSCELLHMKCDGASKIILKNIMSDLIKLHISGSSVITAQGKAKNQTVTIKGASKYHGLELMCNNGVINATLYGCSEAFLAGTSANQEINLSGCSTYHGYALSGTDATINLSACSKGYVNVTNIIQGKISGASHIYYKQHPRTSVICSDVSKCHRIE